MTAHSKRPTWAIVAPLPSNILAEYASKYPSTELLRGAKQHSALINFLPGSEGTDQTLAEEISAANPEAELFLLRFREDQEVVWKYRGGRKSGKEDTDPWESAHSLGCSLLPESATVAVTRSVCVVSGQSPEQVARALGFAQVPDSDAMCILPCAKGTYFYSEKGNVALFLDDVASKTSGRVYLLSARDGGSEFSCSVMEGGSDVGAYEIPVFRSAPLPQLDSIEGKTSPADIAKMLGVPASVLGLAK